MDAYHGPLVNRALGDILGGILGGDDDDDATATSPPLITGLPLTFSIPNPFSTSSSVRSSGSSSATQTITSTSASATSSASSVSVSSSSVASSSGQSSSASSTSASATATSSEPSNTAAEVSQTPVAQNDQTSAQQHTSTITSTASAEETSAVAGGAAVNKGFLQNKPLSISVITIATILGVIFLVIIGTWALRKRRREKLHRLAAELSSDDLVGHRRSFDDVEKGSGSGHSMYGGAAYGGSVDVLEKMEAVGGARHDGRAGPVMPPPVRRSPTQHSASPDPYIAYAQPAYAVPAYAAPMPPTYHDQGYGAPRHDVASPPPAAYYYDNRDYRTSQPGGPAVNMNRMSGSGFLPNPFPTNENAQGLSQLYDLAYTQQYNQQLPVAPVPAPESATADNNRTVTRKPPPRALTVDIQAAAGQLAAPPSAVSAVSLGAMPMQVASSENPANPLAESPKSANGEPRRHSSLLDKGSAPTTPKTPTSDQGHDARQRRLSHTRALDPGMPTPPVAPPLPEEFGTRTPAARQLKIVNA